MTSSVLDIVGRIPLCIAHGVPTTDATRTPKEFQHCSVCRQRMEQEWAADPQLPRNKNGAVLGKSSKSYAAHVESFKGRLLRDAARAIVQQQTGLNIADAAREYPFTYAEATRQSKVEAWCQF